jgi:hypothetical protein
VEQPEGGGVAERAGRPRSEPGRRLVLSAPARLHAADPAATPHQGGQPRGARHRETKLETKGRAVAEAPRGAAVEVWATDEHRIGLNPMLRRVWAPKGQRPVVTIHPRSRWRYLSGSVHPASGRTQWPLCSSSTVALFTYSLTAVAQPAGAGPSKELVLVVDRAGWHMSRRVAIPPHLHLVPVPPYTPEVQPAERLWTDSTTPLLNVRPADLEELDTRRLDRCAALQSDPALVATIQSATH